MSKRVKEVKTNTSDLRQDITSMQLTAEPMPKTSEEKNSVLARTPTMVCSSSAVVCIIDAVTPESNVAIVVMSTYL